MSLEVDYSRIVIKDVLIVLETIPARHRSLLVRAAIELLKKAQAEEKKA